MKQHGIVPDVITCNALISALIGMDERNTALVEVKLEWALKTIEDVLHHEDILPDISTHGALIKGWNEFRERAMAADIERQVHAFLEERQ